MLVVCRYYLAFARKQNSDISGYVPFIAGAVLFRDDCDQLAQVVEVHGDAEALAYRLWVARAAFLQSLPCGSMPSFEDVTKY